MKLNRFIFINHSFKHRYFTKTSNYTAEEYSQAVYIKTYNQICRLKKKKLNCIRRIL